MVAHHGQGTELGPDLPQGFEKLVHIAPFAAPVVAAQQQDIGLHPLQHGH